jgi:DNA-binding LacI/PurR family transcriptional regulator
MTVSNVLRGKPSVDPELRERVERAVAESGYRVNESARALRSGRSGVIGLVVPGIDAAYYGMLGSLVTRAARRAGYTVAIEETRADAGTEAAALERARSLAYDGVIITPLSLDLEAWIPFSRTFPVVFLGERPAPAGTAHIALPNLAGTRTATELLVRRGARSVAFVGAPPSGADDIHSLRVAGYRHGLADAGFAVEAADGDLFLELEQGLSSASAREAVLRADARGITPDAFVAVTDTVAFGVLRALADLGRRVPEDALVVGFDGLPDGEISVPSLSTVSPDHEWIAEQAIALLRSRIEADGATSADTSLEAPFTLVERESTGRR